MYRLSSVGVLALVLAGCQTESEPPPLYVGHVVALGGPDREGGESAVRGVKLAVDWAKEAGQEPPRAFAVLHANARPDAGGFEAEAVRLTVVNGAAALLGGLTAAEAEGLDRAGVPLVTPAGLRTPALSRHAFLTGLSPAFQGETLARFAREHLVKDKAPPRVVVLADTRCEEFTAAAEAFADALSRPSGDAKEKPRRPLLLRYEKDEQLDEHAKTVTAETPGLVFLAGEPEALARLRSRDDKAVGPVLFAGLPGAEATLLSQRLTGNSVFLALPWHAAADTPQNKEFVEKFTKQYQREPDVRAALAYDAARVLFLALHKCDKDVTPQAVQDMLKETKDVTLLTGAAWFDDARGLRRPAFVVELRDGAAELRQKYEPEKATK